MGAADRLQPRHGEEIVALAQAVLKLVGDSRASLGSQLILAALGCPRTSRKEHWGVTSAPRTSEKG